MSASLGPNIANFGTRRQHGEQDQRVGPVEVVEAVDRGPGRAGARAPRRGGAGSRARRPRRTGGRTRYGMAGGPVRPTAAAPRPQSRRPGVRAVSRRCAPDRGRRGSRRTRSASSAAPSAGGTLGLGTRTTNIPAAFPARTPLSESSTTRHRAGSTPSRCGGDAGTRPAPACRARPRRTRRSPRTRRGARAHRSRRRSRRGCADDAIATGSVRGDPPDGVGGSGRSPATARRGSGATTPSTIASSIASAGRSRGRAARASWPTTGGELPPITARWSSAVQAARAARELDPDLVPPRLGVDEDAIEIEQHGVEAGASVLPVQPASRCRTVARPAHRQG